ncbi:MAG: hypothetical protein ACP5UN_01245 [Candidatus Micrarchaeia archaeon]
MKIECCDINRNPQNNQEYPNKVVIETKDNQNIVNNNFNNFENQYSIEELEKLRRDIRDRIGFAYEKDIFKKPSLFYNPKIQTIILAVSGALFSLVGGITGSFALVDLGVSFVSGAIIKSGIEKNRK